MKEGVYAWITRHPFLFSSATYVLGVVVMFNIYPFNASRPYSPLMLISDVMGFKIYLAVLGLAGSLTLFANLLLPVTYISSRRGLPILRKHVLTIFIAVLPYTLFYYLMISPLAGATYIEGMLKYTVIGLTLSLVYTAIYYLAIYPSLTQLIPIYMISKDPFTHLRAHLLKFIGVFMVLLVLGEVMEFIGSLATLYMFLAFKNPYLAFPYLRAYNVEVYSRLVNAGAKAVFLSHIKWAKPLGWGETLFTVIKGAVVGELINQVWIKKSSGIRNRM